MSPARSRSASEGKILPLPRLLELRDEWARRGKRVVFTNGVFDLLHAGHVQILEAAKSLGDILIVGINSDASVRRLGKGPERPLNRLRDRERVVAALGCVDAATAFGEETPEDLLSRLKPDILVKGCDYKVDEVAGRQYAGKLVLLPLKKGYSTTALAAKINGCSLRGRGRR